MQIEMIGVPTVPAPPKIAAMDQLEQAFLEEMLKYCGPGALQGEFSGGAGEDQFNSFLTQEYAGILARKIDLGLSVGTKGNAA